MLLLYFTQFFRRIADSFIPAYRGEFAAFLIANHRLLQTRRQQLGIVEKIPAVIAFKAQLILVGDAISGFGSDNFIVFDDQLKFATGPAIRANARDFFHQ